MKNLILSCLLILSVSIANATPIKDWNSNSLEHVKNTYKNQPFLLVLWSLDCPSCFKEFTALGKWLKKHSQHHVVIVSTDSSTMLPDVRDVINEYNLNNTDLWIYSKENPVKLRQSVDSKWFGELPRSYFFNKQHQSKAHSGALTDEQLNLWHTLISKTNTQKSSQTNIKPPN